MKRVAFLLVLILATVPAADAWAIMRHVALEEVAASSDAILRGQVVDQQARWTDDHKTIVTEVGVRVAETWVGQIAPGTRVSVEVRGGEVPPIGMRVDDQPVFQQGEDVVLFLAGHGNSGLTVNQDVQGKLTVDGDRVVTHDGVSYSLSEFRSAAQRSQAPGGSQGTVVSPPGDGGPRDDDNYSWCGIKWFPGRLPYTWWLNQNGAPGCTLNDTFNAAASGFNTWMCASDVSMAYGGTTGLDATNHSDGSNVLAWEYGTLGSGTIALCSYVYYVQTGEIIEVDIEFNATWFTWSCSGSPTDMDVADIATHEIGHTLCLGDLYGGNDTNKTMYGYSSQGEFNKRTLLRADALGADFIYPHAEPNFVSWTPGGWYSPLVPRNTADSNPGYAPLPSELYGNAYCYVNAGMNNNGGDCASPSGINNMWLDHVFTYWNSWGGVWGVGYVGTWTNLAHWVAGGRHTLSYTLDDNQETLESNESDNTYHAQYVWSPLLTGGGAPNVRVCPPVWGVFGLPNSDGMSFTRDTSYAWVTSLAPWTPGDDYDLYLYDDYSGSLSGFSNLRATSAYGGNATDFVVGHYSGTPGTVYPAAVRYDAPTAYYYSADQIDASGRNASDSGSWPNQYLADYRLADVYEAYLTAGTTYRIDLAREAGSADIAFNIYPGTTGGIYGRSSAAGFSNGIDPAHDQLDFTATTTAWHPIVVYRLDGTDQSALVYSLYWNPASADAGNVKVSAPVLTFFGAVPNPMRGTARFAFQLPAREEVRLDLYDVGGRHVCSLLSGNYGPGPVEQVWNGRTDDGRPVGAGMYWARLRTGGGVITRLVTVLD